MLVRLVRTIPSKSSKLDYNNYCYFTSLLHSMTIFVLHQARGLLTIVKVHFFQTRGIKRLNSTGISNLNSLFIQEMKSSGATVGL